MRTLLVGTAFLSLLLYCANPVEAETCAAQLSQLCASDAETPGEFLECARAKDGQLSEDCRLALEKGRNGLRPRRGGRIRELRAGCLPDVQRLCPETASNRKEAIRCLKQHRDEISPRCNEAARVFLAKRKTRGGLNR